MHGGKGGAATTLHPKNEVAAAEAWGGLTASFHETTKQAPLLISSVPENLFPALKLAGRQAPPILHIIQAPVRSWARVPTTESFSASTRDPCRPTWMRLAPAHPCPPQPALTRRHRVGYNSGVERGQFIVSLLRL